MSLRRALPDLDENPDAPQRRYALREVCNAVRWPVRTGAQWRMPRVPAVESRLPADPAAVAGRGDQGDGPRPARPAALGAGPRGPADRSDHATGARCRAGGRAGDAGAKREAGTKLHAAVATLSGLPTPHVTAARAQDRALRIWSDGGQTLLARTGKLLAYYEAPKPSEEVSGRESAMMERRG